MPLKLKCANDSLGDYAKYTLDSIGLGWGRESAHDALAAGTWGPPFEEEDCGQGPTAAGLPPVQGQHAVHWAQWLLKAPSPFLWPSGFPFRRRFLPLSQENQVPY